MRDRERYEGEMKEGETGRDGGRRKYEGWKRIQRPEGMKVFLSVSRLLMNSQLTGVQI